MTSRSYILLLILSLLVSCRTNRLTNIRVTDAYDPDAGFARWKYTTYHVSDSVTRVYVLINSEDLLYAREMGKSEFSAKLKIHYDLVSAEDPKILMDSSSIFITDTTGFQKRIPVIDSFDLQLSLPGKYFLQMQITDLQKKSVSSNSFYIVKENPQSRQNFMIRDADNSPIFDIFIEASHKFTLITNNTLIPRLFVRYYKGEFPVATPPYVEMKGKGLSFRPDSVFFIEMNEGSSQLMSFPAKGIYHVQTDTSGREGFTIFRFHQGFPEITQAEQMRPPLRHISSKTEFNGMMMMKNVKEAVDNFWLDKAGNPDRAKELIRRYYSRVIEANRYFTSYHEGWKTDRGMIYIIFGTPSLVYRNPASETWIYGEDRNLLSMTFIFKKVENPFSDNDYELERSQEYKDVWFSAIEGWTN